MFLILRRGIAIALLVTTTGCSTLSGWFSLDDEEVNQPAELQKFTEAVRLKKLWSESVGNGQGDGLYRLMPAIQGDQIYAVSNDGEVVALQLSSGKRIWRQALDQSVSGGVGVSGERLFVGTSEGQVLALDAGNGSVLWRQTLRGEVLSAPQSDGRVVVVQTYDGRAQGLDAKTGDLLWTYDSNVPVLTIRGTSTPILRDGNAYVGFANGRVVAFDVEKGTVEWELRVAIAQGRSEIERMVDIDGALEIIGNELYAASYQGYLVAADVRTGRKLWQQEVSTVSGVSQGFSNVYVSDQDGTVSAYYRNGQGLRWAQSDLSYRAPTKPVPVASYLAFTDFDGVLHLLSQVDGRFVGRDKIGAAARADIISQGNRFFVFTDKGKLIAYEVSAKD